VEKYNIGLVVPSTQLDCLFEIIQTVDYSELLRNIHVFRKEYAIEAHIGTLGRFFTNVVNT